MKQSLYDMLGVAVDASAADIKKAYRQLAKDHHPDANNGADDEEFKRISHAYSILSDPDRREMYDLTGEAITSDEWNKRVMGTLLPMIYEAFKQDASDPLELTRGAIRHSIKEATVARAKRQKSLDKVTKKLARFSCKNRKDNPIADLIGGLIDIELGKLQQNNLQVTLGEAMLEVLEQYHYEQETQEPSLKGMGGMMFTSSMFESYFTQTFGEDD